MRSVWGTTLAVHLALKLAVCIFVGNIHEVFGILVLDSLALEARSQLKSAWAL